MLCRARPTLAGVPCDIKGAGMADEWVRGDADNLVHVAVEGSGPLVLLLAGTGHDSSDWQRAGYVEVLAERFTVAAIDLPGQGLSAGTADPARYALPELLGLLDRIADHLGASAFAVIGYSSGGSLALQAASRDPGTSVAIVMAAFIGKSLDADTVARSTRQALAVHEAKLAGTLDALPLTPAQRETAARLDIPAHIAWMHAAMSWPPVLPADLHCPTLLYLGSADPLVPVPAVPASGPLLSLHTQPELDHTGVFEASGPAISAALTLLIKHQPW